MELNFRLGRLQPHLRHWRLCQTRAIQAGHTAFGQGEVAARNILRLIAKEEEEMEKTNDEELEEYEAPKPAIKR
ncbi:uncharacterized protein IAS62_001918 [Cryptococcus decagattii]|uniref:Uncharacterized protein n=1 Tax=Cryptococcus decagattii TaxID=1859122 RepID=A0ABZ2AQ68_9TREE